jgi:DNA-binding NarL/FixJ family response regulator
MIVVEVIEHNPLATRYLRTLLKHSRQFQLTFSNDLSPVQLADRADTILVVDRGSLPSNPFHVQFPDTNKNRVIVIDDALNANQVCDLLIIGVCGFVPYNKVEHTLSRAIKNVADGHLWVEPKALELLAQELVLRMRSTSQKRHTFSSRQHMVMELLRARLSNKEIGANLGISERTVKFHLTNIYGKLGVNDRHAVAELVAKQPHVLPIALSTEVKSSGFGSHSCRAPISMPRSR